MEGEVDRTAYYPTFHVTVSRLGLRAQALNG